MVADLFSLAAATIAPTRERNYLVDLATASMRPKPTTPPWLWASQNVWLGGKMSAKPQQYNPSLTPWTKEWQELPLRDDVRVGVALKPSRSGFTEGAFNILRWMPHEWPGNALYAINSQKLAREIVSRRIMPTLEQTAAALLPEDPNDKTLSRISFPTMDMVFSGSGSAGPFMEMWYRLIILDELENHIQDQDTTTYQRAISRQTDVPDGLILAIAKPEKAGGIIHILFISGTQKKYLVPCPRCDRPIELKTEYLIANGFENGRWDLHQVSKETYYQCQLCNGRIEEKEKHAMVQAGIWVPTPLADRMRPPSGQYVPPEPGVESYHISDLYSLHARATWGELKKMWLMAHVIAPSESAKKYFRSNHEGLPFESEIFAVNDESIKALKAGRVEEVKTEAPDGTTQLIKQTVAPHVLLTNAKGEPREPIFRLAYLDGQKQAPLPFKPKVITISIDKQSTFLQYVVFAWLADGQAFFIDVGTVQDEDQLHTLRTRPYEIDGEAEPMYIFSGLFDAGHRPHEVYRFCLNAFLKHGWNVWPARGEGQHEEYKGKTWRLMKDYIDGRQLMVRYFYDHGIKNELYIGQIQKRNAPRLWMPDDLPESVIRQLTSEKYDETKQEWEHERSKDGPNDIGDCFKLQYVLLQEMRQSFTG